MNVPRKARGIGRPHHHARGRVGAATTPTAAPGFVTVFPGWNVWALWRSDNPDRSVFADIWNAGMSPDRELQVWVENQIKDNANGAAVADPANPAALRGDQIKIIPGANGLVVDGTRADIPELAGPVQLGEQDSKASRVFVRFYNRGQQALMPWPHDANVLLDASFLPSTSNALTNGAAPSSLGGAAAELEKQVESVVKVIAIGGGLVLATVLVIAIANASKKAAA